ncbi:MAG: glycoside hydrolase family 2 protein [Lachnospiraceae bacterium]|nr:glycoside hydrolase family 2 protein [Lachnospiraceae bacterium]
MRSIISMNEDWRFIQGNAGLPDILPQDWQKVNLPHTWNAVDGMDGNGAYDRGTYWYAKEFATPKQALPGGRVYVEILAAGQQATVYVNGREAAYHEGGYSIFRADITGLCKEEGENLLVIACSNEYKESVYPQSADFTFYGGLYRGVNLISVPQMHFDLDYYGGPGIVVTPKPDAGTLSAGQAAGTLEHSNAWNAEQGHECTGASFEIETWVTDPDENFTVMYSVRDVDGCEVASAVRPADDTRVTVYAPDAQMWDMEHPYLYTVTATLQRRNEAYDEISARVGVRSFSADPSKGFILNGVETPLRGVSRHQDLLYKGNALSREDHYRDAELIKELGANTVRLAHYQHDQYFYDACDELGFAVWAEIPFISVFNDDPAAHQNCISQMKELIIQNYNHPSIMFWGISNEILIGGISEQLVENHKELNELCHQLDPTRLTTMAHVTMTPIESPIHGITDVESYNHYFGWYGGSVEDNGPWLDNFHKVHPDICLGLSEYGCEGIITYHGSHPACKDYSEEYQALYHEHMAKVLDERPWMWSSHVWNMFDFGCAARNEGGVAGRNNKGLMTMDRRTKKDSYFIYQAYWTTKPMVHICGRRYAQRAMMQSDCRNQQTNAASGSASSTQSASVGGQTEIRVYSNQPTVALYLNGKLLEEKSADKVFVFHAALEEGFNTVLALAGDVKDSITLERVEKEPSIYVLPEVNERNEGVANWFKLAGDLNLDSPMEFPEGKYSIRDKVEEIAKNPEAFAVLSEGFKLAMNMELKPGEGVWGMMKSMNMEEILKTGGSMVPDGFAESLNAKLIRFSKTPE